MRRIRFGWLLGGLCLLFLQAGRAPAYAEEAGPARSVAGHIREPEEELPLPGKARLFNAARTAGRLPEGITACGQSLAGWTPAEARSLIRTREKEGEDSSLYLVLPEGDKRITLSSYRQEWANEDSLRELKSLALSGNAFAQYAQSKNAKEHPRDFTPQYAVNEEKLGFLVDNLVSSYAGEVRNASIVRKNGTFSVVKEERGIAMDGEQIRREMLGLIAAFTAEDISYTVPMTVTEPAYTAEDFAFSEEPLGSYSTRQLGDGWRLRNIEVSAANMNGHVFYPGEQISALAMYGPVTTEAGYGPAAGFETGRVVQTIGGGVCQTTTTLYNAALLAELDITYRRHHSMIVSYVPPAMDATVVPQEGGDFLMVNSTGHPIYIEAYVRDEALTVNIWGIDERPQNRSIAYTTEILSLTWPQTLYNQIVDDASCTKGSAHVSKKQHTDVAPHPALHARSYKHVYVDGQETETVLLTDDTYNPMSGVVYRASDCRIQTSVVEAQGDAAVYPYLGVGFYLHVTDVYGNPWPGPAGG